LALPEDAQWGDLGKKHTFLFFLNVFTNFIILNVFMFIQELIKNFLFDDTDVGPYRPPGTYPIQWRGEAALVVRWDD
jgi:hypothetical protein